MNLHVLTKGNRTLIEGESGSRIFNSPNELNDLISACWENGANALLLHTENLPAHFFDLSSGEAGHILQKLRQYNIKLAVVLTPDGPQPSTMFRELLKEENKGPDFRTFDNRDAAEAWLVS